MDPRGIELAREELAEAKEAFSLFQTAPDYETANDQWRRFLGASARVFEKLKTASKSDEHSQRWFASQQNLRFSDPLLIYIREARNSSEHGLEPYTELKKGSAQITAKGSTHIQRITVHERGLRIVSSNPEALRVKVELAQTRLVRVYSEKLSRWFETPEEHLGTPVDGTDPNAVASLTIAFLEDLVQQVDTYLGG
jgi:hypothetical protein